MYFVYSLLLTLGFLLLLPRFLFDAVRHGKYVAGFGERLGLLHPIDCEGRPVVWLHCVSVGETQAARPLVKGIRRRFSNHHLVVSTITLTGHNLARELFAQEAVRILYFPFDWRWTVRRSLRAVNPSAVLLMETELWPGFLHECHAQQIPVTIVNGRLSERSFRRYKFVKGFVSRVLNCLTLAVMQTDSDAERIHRLGLHPDKIFVSGNMKFDAGTMSGPSALASEFRERFKIADDAALIVAASTHYPEERIVLEAFRSLRTQASEKPRLVLAPRHPERFAEVASLLAKTALTWTRRTALTQSTDGNCDVILLDTIGELPALYSLASVVFVGGSIANSGGHNILEPAAAGAAIVTGAHTHNFEAIVNQFLEDRALIQLPRVSQQLAEVKLANVFKELLNNKRQRNELGQRARNLVDKNLGATDRTLKLLDSILSNPPGHQPTR